MATVILPIPREACDMVLDLVPDGSNRLRFLTKKKNRI